MKRWLLALVAALVLSVSVAGGASAACKKWQDDSSSSASVELQTQGLIRPGGTWGFL